MPVVAGEQRRCLCWQAGRVGACGGRWAELVPVVAGGQSCCNFDCDLVNDLGEF